MDRDAVVLLSGGLDSTVAATLAAGAGGVRLALTVDYGQRAAEREAAAAREIAAALDVPWQRVELGFLGQLGSSALTSAAEELPSPRDDQLDGPDAQQSADRVWVPNRNGVLLSVAAAHAEALGAGCVVMGFNREEAATFPDNSVEFVLASNGALRYSTRGAVRLVAPTADLDKEGLVRLGRARGAPLQHVWVCYRGGEEHCGRCESCRRFARALERAEAAAWWRDARRGTLPARGAAAAAARRR
jgi:7-cyano-7-deazaguanine synthase